MTADDTRVCRPTRGPVCLYCGTSDALCGCCDTCGGDCVKPCPNCGDDDCQDFDCIDVDD